MPPITPNSTPNAIPNLASLAKHIADVTGMAVFPTGLDKTPQVRRARRELNEVGGYRFASCVPAEIEQLFRAGEARSASGYGVVPEGSTVAIDLDTDKAGWEDALAYARDMIQAAGSPQHLETVTPRGGIHLFVRVMDEQVRASLGSVVYWRGNSVGDARHDSNGYFVEGGSKARVKGTTEVANYTFQLWTGGSGGSAASLRFDEVTPTLWGCNAVWTATHLKPLIGKAVALVSVDGEIIDGVAPKAVATLDLKVGTPVDCAKLTSAVMHIARKGGLDSYDGWMRIGSALKNTCDDGLLDGGDLAGLNLFITASRVSKGYEGDEQVITKWHQLGGRTVGDDRVSVGSVFYEAGESGWKDKVKTLKEILSDANDAGNASGASDASDAGDVLYTDEWAGWDGDDSDDSDDSLPITTVARAAAKAPEASDDSDKLSGDEPIGSADREAAMRFLLSRDLMSPTPGSPEDMKDLVRYCDLMGDMVFSEMSNYMFNRHTGMLDRLDASSVSSSRMARSVRRLAHAIESIDTEHGTWNGIKRDAAWVAAATAPLKDAKGNVVKDSKTGKDKVPVPPCAQRCAISQTKDFESYMKIGMTTGQTRITDAEAQQRKGVMAFECGNVIDIKLVTKRNAGQPLTLENVKLEVRPITRNDKVSGKIRGSASRTAELMELYMGDGAARASAVSESLWFKSCVFLCFHSNVEVASWLAGEVFASLMGYPDSTKSVFITGTSQAGKGTFLQTCAKIVRGPATFEIDAGNLYREKDNMLLLAPSLSRGLCGFVTELSEDDGIHLSRFKRLHGRDSIGTCREMYSQRTFTVQNHAQYFVGANDIPYFKGAASDIAPIKSRLLMIDVYNDRPLSERDVNYGIKVLAQETLAPLGLLWGIEQVLAKRNGTYSIPETVKNAVADEVEDTNPLAGYFALCPQGKDLMYSRAKFMKDMLQYAVNMGLREPNSLLVFDRADPLSSVRVAKFIKRSTNRMNNRTVNESRVRVDGKPQESFWFGFGEPA